MSFVILIEDVHLHIRAKETVKSVSASIYAVTQGEVYHKQVQHIHALYSASRKYSHRFAFSSICYVEVSFLNGLN